MPWAKLKLWCLVYYSIKHGHQSIVSFNEMTHRGGTLLVGPVRGRRVVEAQHK